MISIKTAVFAYTLAPFHKKEYFYRLMDGTSSDIHLKNRRYFFVFVAMAFVLLTSCPIKKSIRSLAGIPVNTEQSVAKSSSLLASATEQCTGSEIGDTKIVRAFSFNANDVLPAVAVAAVFLFLRHYAPGNEPSHPRYGNLKIPGALPIFLRYRKLLI